MQVQITLGPLCVLETFWATIQPKLCVRVSINFEVRYDSSPALTALLTAHELGTHYGTCPQRDRRLQQQTPSMLQLQLFQLLLSQGLAGFGFGCNASFDNCCTPGSSIYSRIFSFPAHTDTVHTYVCMCVQVRKVMTATQCVIVVVT